MDDEEIREAIRSHPAEAAEALVAVQAGNGVAKPLTADAIAAAAAILGEAPDQLWLDRLRVANLVLAFVNALRARGVAMDEEALHDPEGAIPIEALNAFLPRAKAFRCRVLVNGAIAGSGILVGPSLVLTSWHVIAVAAPGRPQEPAPGLSVQLADDTKQPATVPARFESKCGDAEFDWIAPKRDEDVDGRNDVALLAMSRPAATHLGYVPLTAPAAAPRTQARVVLVHFPNGKDVGVDFGITGKIRNVTARWRHSLTTDKGSSGGACFNRELEFVGIHQGKFDEAGRFVPVGRFIDDVLPIVALDIAPKTLWSLDGTVTAPLVVGRDLLFETIAVAGDPAVRVRGLRIKRRSIGSRAAGLAYSHDILFNLLARRGTDHVLVRVAQDEIVSDLVAEIRRRVQVAGIEIPDSHDEAGVAPGQAPPETTAKDRAANLAAAIEAAAATRGQTVWFFFDNPSVALSEAARLGFEGFVDASLVQPHLRLVVAGFETLPLPGLEFAGPSVADGNGPGLVVEYIGGFRRADLLDVMTRASQELTGTADLAALTHTVDLAIGGLPEFNGVFEDEQLAVVTERLGLELASLARAAGGGG